MPLVDLGDANFDSEIEKHPLIILDFWAPWCAPCKAFAPIFAAAAEKHPDILFARINTEEEAALAAQFEVRSIPTLLGVRDGTIVKVQMGALPPEPFEKMIAEVRG